MPEIPRGEYPRPQLVRANWLSLNGQWQFEIDQGDSGIHRGVLERELSDLIVVPFCPESELSGIGDTAFHEAVWYRRTVRIPIEWANRRVLLHFQAVDHDATVWVNGVEVVRHRGGWTPFTCDITHEAPPGGEATVVVRARDPRNGVQARGKQSVEQVNSTSFYTRTTGIWQSVWLEPVSAIHLLRPRITPDVGANAIHLELPLAGNAARHVVRASLRDAAGEIVAASTSPGFDLMPRLALLIPADRRRLWSMDDPFLYDLVLEVVDEHGDVVDRAESYAGLRGISIDGKAVLLNGEPVFQRLVLDQGYYPDGIMTAPDDEALVRDIQLAQAAGFNGARLHQKVFEERFLYHADRLGYLVWGEFGDWGCFTGPIGEAQEPTATYVTQWLEAVARDYSHPSIIGWCPTNETQQPIHDRITILDDVTTAMFLATKAADPTRPVIDASGYSHRVPHTDIYDAHLYEQDPTRFAEALSGLAEGRPFVNGHYDGRAWCVPYRGQPYFLSEFGGIWWNPDDVHSAESWGHGDPPQSLTEVYARFEGLVAALLNDPLMFGYCYTQLTDVFQEKNGIYYFDRRPKLDVARVKRAQERPAAIEMTANDAGAR